MYIEDGSVPRKDKAVLRFLEENQARFDHPMSLSGLVVQGGLNEDSPYVNLFLPGGYGAMVGLPDDENVGTWIRLVHDSDGYLVVVYHGPAALMFCETDLSKPLETTLTKPTKQSLKQFSKGRVSMIKSHLMTTEELLAFRSQIEEASAGNHFCDSCAFCCVDGVETLGIEAERIRGLVQKRPDLHQPRGFVCPFLEMSPERLHDNIANYGQNNKPLHASSCRIYEERPILCRLFPAPNEEQCRKYNISKAPELNQALLSQKTGEDFPETLLEKYYLTFRWEWMNYPTSTQWDLEYHLIPGWQCNEEDVAVEKKEGPQWLLKFDVMPHVLPSPTSYQLADWEFRVVRSLESPVNYQQLIEHFVSEVDAYDLGALLGQLEFMNIIVPIDIGRRMAIGRKRAERIID